MTSLYEELHPLALQVEEARTGVVEAARLHLKDQDEAFLAEMVHALEEAQMALGLKTAQLLLSRGGAGGGPPTVAGQEEFMRDEPLDLDKPVVQLRGAGEKPHVGTAWGKKREV